MDISASVRACFDEEGCFVAVGGSLGAGVVVRW